MFGCNLHLGSLVKNLDHTQNAELLACGSGEPVIRKKALDVFFETALTEELENSAISQLAVG